MLTLKSRIRLTIGTKLVGLIAILLMASVVSLVWLSTRMFIEDNTALIQQTNADTAASLATQMREQFENLNEKMRVLGTVLMQDAQADAKERIIREFFAKDKDFLAVINYKHNEDGTSQVHGRAISPELVTLGDPDAMKTLTALSQEKDFSLVQVTRGEVQISSIKLSDGSPAVALAIPFIQSASAPDKFIHTLIAFVRQARFVKAFSESDIVTSFMVDRKGKLLAHPDATRVAAAENVSHLPVVKELLAGKTNNKQMPYTDPQSGERKLGAFRIVGFGGLGVVTEVAEAKAFEAAKRVEYRASLVALIVLCISFFTGYLYSGTITWPIKQLVRAAHQISEGDFNINLKPKSKDEVAQLSLAFNEMAKGLEERDKVKETFNKFHNKEIAEKLLSGEVKLGGERKEAVVFFSDVRGFTALSESMEPEQVVEMLNEYMTRMVSIIRAHGGVVDKYVGDAIMALWGVPISGPDDAYNAVKACIGMRQGLAELNELRLSRGQGVLKIGMGLNIGQVIAGNIGSNEKMEYTVIGDTVNLASRIESMTKEYGTDFLISKSIHERIENRFVFEACKSAKVKGKSNAIELFKVKGYVDGNGQQVIVETPYSSYASEKSDKAVHEEPAAEEALESAPEAAPVHPTMAAQSEPATSSNIFLDRTQMIITPSAEPTATVEVAIPLPTLPSVHSDKNWFFTVENEVFGPFTPEEIREGLRTNELTPEMLVSEKPEGPWAPLAEQADFKGSPFKQAA